MTDGDPPKFVKPWRTGTFALAGGWSVTIGTVSLVAYVWTSYRFPWPAALVVTVWASHLCFGFSSLYRWTKFLKMDRDRWVKMATHDVDQLVALEGERWAEIRSRMAEGESWKRANE